MFYSIMTFNSYSGKQIKCLDIVFCFKPPLLLITNLSYIATFIHPMKVKYDEH